MAFDALRECIFLNDTIAAIHHGRIRQTDCLHWFDAFEGGGKLHNTPQDAFRKVWEEASRNNVPACELFKR